MGYRTIQNGCQPTGDWIAIVEGDNWVREWPATVSAGWFFPWAGQSRVLHCDWGWYLAELNDAGWRNYWQGEVLRQLRANDGDGVFLDSLSVPNYLGADRFSPALPPLDSAFEGAWTARINNWLTWLQGQAVGEYDLVPNAGAWINNRDSVDYGLADGVMIEGFAIPADASSYPLGDWLLQVNRALGMIQKGRVVIGQTYASGNQERLFALGTYLLIKGQHTFLNIDLGLEPEWWPEYDIPIGVPTESAGADIADLYDGQVYRRSFDNGLVLVNPTSPWDGSGVTHTVDLGGTFCRAQTSGGGEVPASGVPSGSISYQAVTSVTLPPYSAAVLLTCP
ncbi:MAG: hypothetical protein HY335_01195 [Deinococcus sp.]|nr:hypothetical protein [Deinococcus sp.]